MNAVIDLGAGLGTVQRGGELVQYPVSADLSWLAGVPTLVVVVPDEGHAGLARLERLHRSVVSQTSPTYVSRPVALAAAAAGRISTTGAFLVCDAGQDAMTLAVVDVEDRQISLSHSEIVPGLGARAFARTVAEALGTDARILDLFTTNAARLATVLPAARKQEIFRDAPVFEVAGHPVDAGFLLDCFAPFEALLRSRVPEPVKAVVLTGVFSTFPLLADALGGAKLLRPGPHAPTHGGLFVADGRFTERVPDRPVTVLPIHRRLNGRLEEVAVPLPSGPGAFAELSGAPLRLAIGGATGTLQLGGSLDLEVGEVPSSLDVGGLPFGAYRVGLRVAGRGAAALAFSTDDHNDPIFIPLEAMA